jgi:hypothetical protein
MRLIRNGCLKVAVSRRERIVTLDCLSQPAPRPRCSRASSGMRRFGLIGYLLLALLIIVAAVTLWRSLFEGVRRRLGHHRASHGISVTESCETLPPKREEREVSRVRLVDWIVPPVIVPLLRLLLLLVVGVAALHG